MATFEARLIDPDGYTVPRAVEIVTADQLKATEARLLAKNAVAHAAEWGEDARGYWVQVTELSAEDARHLLAAA